MAAVQKLQSAQKTVEEGIRSSDDESQTQTIPSEQKEEKV